MFIPNVCVSEIVAGTEDDVADGHPEDGHDEDELPAHLRHHGQGHEAGDEEGDAHDDARDGRTDGGVDAREDGGAVEHHHVEPGHLEEEHHK